MRSLYWDTIKSMQDKKVGYAETKEDKGIITILTRLLLK
jgi:hypothetical protein